MDTSRTRSVVSLVAVAISLALLVPAPAMALVQPVRVVGEPGVVETLPFANDTWIAFAQNTRTRPNRFNAYAEPLAGGTRRKVNEARTLGFPGSFDPGTNTLIYQQVRRSSNLMFIDLDTMDRSAVPDVNSGAWEWSPRLSSSYILFNRDTVRNSKIVTTLWLYNRNTSTFRQIEEWRDPGLYTPAGNVGDDYATFTVCSPQTCRAFVYTIASQTTRRIPSVDGRPVYAPVVDEANGDLYFMRSGYKCGQNAAVWRLPIDDFEATPTKIAELGTGFDSFGGAASLAQNASVMGSQDLYYERAICRNFQSDIFAFRDVTSVPDGTTMRLERATASTFPKRFVELPDDLQR